MLKYSIIISSLITLNLLALDSHGQEAIGVKKVMDMDLNSKEEVWQSVSSHEFNASNSGDFEVAGEFVEGDLDISLKLAWNDEALFVYIDWLDNDRDSKRIPKDSSTFTTASGRRMDKMYLYDNMKIQLRFEGYNYVNWFQPDKKALQWHSLRKRNSDGKSTVLDISEPSFTCIENSGEYSLRVKYQWEDFQLENGVPSDIQFLLLVNDRDNPKADFTQRTKDKPKYIALQKKLML